MSFSDQVNDFVNGAIDGKEAIHKAATISLFKDIVISSPVKEGRFRSNWFASDASPSTSTGGERSEGATIQAMTATINSLPFGTFTFTNNLPYAQTIEFGQYNHATDRTTAQGFSSQAPEGVVRVNANRWNKNIEEAARKHAN